MKPAWDELMDAYADSKDVLVADVDCTTEGAPLCSANEVRGFPTIKYGTPGSLEKYTGKRDVDSLKEFAEENLKPACSPSSMEHCDDENKAKIKKFQEMDPAALDAAIAADEQKLKEREEKYTTEVRALVSEFNNFKREKISFVSAIKAVRFSGDKSAKDEL